MSISIAGISLPPGVQPLGPAPSNADQEASARNRTLASAVRLLNDTGAAGSSHEFSIAIDPTTRQAVIRIMDRSTNEVVEQLPSEYLLRVARELTETIAQQSSASTDKTL